MWLFINITTMVASMSILEMGVEHREETEELTPETPVLVQGNNNTTHDCEVPCKVWVEDMNMCVVRKCYKWDDYLGKCESAGPSKITGLILSVIPVTSMLGIHWIVAGQWGWFTVSIVTTFGFCVLTCILLGCSMCLCKTRTSESFSECWGMFSKCFVVIQTIAMIVLWIMGMVMISENNIRGLYNDEYWGEIYCPYV